MKAAFDDSTHILFIEDNHLDERLVRMALARDEGKFQIELARNLSDGLTKLRNGAFDIVLSDLGLPDATGLDVVRKLKSGFDTMPLVVLTGLEDETVAMQALDAGAQDYLIKGCITAEGLKRAIRYAIQRQQNSVMRRMVSRLRANQDALRRKNKKLKELHAIALQFVDNVSHEFRTPLTVIKEYVSLIAEGIVGEVNEQQHRMLLTVEDRADDLNTMVDDMLDVSKLGAGSLSVSRKKCTIQEILKHVYPSLEKKAMLRKVSIEIQLDDDLPDLYCDGEKASRVIINLVVNAIKFCGNPGCVLVTAIHKKESGEVEIRVTDNGPGIAEEALAIIFERFTQVDSAMYSRSTKGFGLGLNIAKELVRLNFGKIGVTSQSGNGSTFSFTLPCNEPQSIVEKYLEQASCGEGKGRRVSLFIARLSDPNRVDCSHEIDSLFDYIARSDDLVYRLNDQQWLVIAPMSESEVGEYIERLESTREQISRNRPMGPLPQFDIAEVGSFSLESPSSEISELIAEVIRASTSGNEDQSEDRSTSIQGKRHKLLCHAV